MDIVLDYNVLDYLQHQTSSTNSTPSEKERERSRGKTCSIDNAMLYCKATSIYDTTPAPDIPDRDQICRWP